MINATVGSLSARPAQPFTPIIIDIEASGFGGDSYPIEIGVALSAVKRYCRLIKPQSSWQHWSAEAEALHGISRQVLASRGVSVSQVCLELNHLLAGQTIYSDGWVVDSPWLNRLYESASIAKGFKVSALEVILNEKQMELWHSTKERLFAILHESRHRASSDAALIQMTYLETRKTSELQNHP